MQPLTADTWAALLAGAGRREIARRTWAIDTQAEAKGILQRYGLGGSLGILWRMLLLYARSPAYRRFARRTRETGVLPPHLEEYFGYGIFVGRRPASVQMTPGQGRVMRAARVAGPFARRLRLLSGRRGDLRPAVETAA